MFSCPNNSGVANQRRLAERFLRPVRFPSHTKNAAGAASRFFHGSHLETRRTRQPGGSPTARASCQRRRFGHSPGRLEMGAPKEKHQPTQEFRNKRNTTHVFCENDRQLQRLPTRSRTEMHDAARTRESTNRPAI